MRGGAPTPCRQKQPIIGSLRGLRAGHNVVFPLILDILDKFCLAAAGFADAACSSGRCGEIVKGPSIKW